MQNISKILVDADACPVKNAIVQVGTKFYVEILFVATMLIVQENSKVIGSM
ncbi:Protein of unknown function [Bacillus mycoides]|nr:Protein of unknown function [Bacillus mycoides]